MHPHDETPDPHRPSEPAALIRQRRNGAALACFVLTALATLMIMASHDEPAAWQVYCGGLAIADAAAVMIACVGALHGHVGIVQSQEHTNGLLRQILTNQAAIREDIGELRTDVAQAREEAAVVSERVTVAEQHLGARLDTVAHRTREQTGVIHEALAGNVRRISGGHGYTETTPPGGTRR